MPLPRDYILEARYRVAFLLGQGGFGAVYYAWDQHLGQPCAVKENLDTSSQAVRQFRREAELLSRLRHPSLPVVIDHFFIPERGQYLIMDFIEGQDLEQRLAEEGRLDEGRALRWLGQVLEALEYLHSQSPPIIHRDVKPANVVITPEERAVLVDFGIAKAYNPALTTTRGARAVSPGFAPPEQYGHGRTDARSDVYAAAATLYALLTGREPAEATDRVSGSAMLIPPRQLNPALSRSAASALEKALALPMAERFATAAAFREALQGHATPAPPAERAIAVPAWPPGGLQLPEDTTSSTAGDPSPPTADPQKRAGVPAWSWLLLIAFALLVAALILVWLT